MSGAGSFIPRPGEGFPPSQPGQPMGPSYDPAAGAGLSDEVMNRIVLLGAEYKTALDAFSRAKQNVDAQIAAVKTGTVLLETITTTILPLITEIIVQRQNEVKEPDILDKLKGDLKDSIGSVINVKTILSGILGSVGIPISMPGVTPGGTV